MYREDQILYIYLNDLHLAYMLVRLFHKLAPVILDALFLLYFFLLNLAFPVLPVLLNLPLLLSLKAFVLQEVVQCLVQRHYYEV